MAHFERYIGIDYSGAQTSSSGLTGLRVYVATPERLPTEVVPQNGPRRNWTRRSLAEWLASKLRTGPVTAVGIDHGFSFPQRYFDEYGLPPDWSTFLDDFQEHWPTDRDGTTVQLVRDGLFGRGFARRGSSRWRRLTEVRACAKSVFHFDVPGSVAKSTHAGLPWLRLLRRQLRKRVHFWPFDGWIPQSHCSVVAEVYPALVSGRFSKEGRNGHQHDAYCAAWWLRERDASGELEALFSPQLLPAERIIARTEGWILGVD